MAAVVAVEGISDRVAVETLAGRLGIDLEAGGVSVVPVGGAQAIGRFVAGLDPRERVVGLCDVAEERYFTDALAAHDVFVCDPDLEGELIRAIGARPIEKLLAGHGDLAPFRTLQKQPQWRGRPVEEQLRRFFGSGGRRKIRYARHLVEALDLERMPAPLAGVFARIG
jgi:OLD-like protein